METRLGTEAPLLLKSNIIGLAADLTQLISTHPDIFLKALESAKDKYNNSWNPFKVRAEEELVPLIEEFQKCLPIINERERNIAFSQFMNNLAKFFSGGTWYQNSINTFVVTSLLEEWKRISKQFPVDDKLPLGEIEHLGRWLINRLATEADALLEKNAHLNDPKPLSKVNTKKLEDFLKEEIKGRKEKSDAKHSFSAENKKLHHALFDGILTAKSKQAPGEKAPPKLKSDQDATVEDEEPLRKPIKKFYSAPEIRKIREVNPEAVGLVEGLLLQRTEKKKQFTLLKDVKTEAEKEAIILKHTAVDKPIVNKLNKDMSAFAQLEKQLSAHVEKLKPVLAEGRLQDKLRNEEEFKRRGYKTKKAGWRADVIEPDYSDSESEEECLSQTQNDQTNFAEDDIDLQEAIIPIPPANPLFDLTPAAGTLDLAQAFAAKHIPMSIFDAPTIIADSIEKHNEVKTHSMRLKVGA